MDESLQTVGYLVLGLLLGIVAVGLFYFGLTDQSTTLMTKIALALIAFGLGVLSWVILRVVRSRVRG